MDTDDLSTTTTNSTIFYDMKTNLYGSPIVSQWKNVQMSDMETQISSPARNDMSIQTIGIVSNILDNCPPRPPPPPSTSSNVNNSVIIQTLPISMTSTHMQTISEQQPQQQQQHTYYPYQESVGTSCLLDDFLLDSLSNTTNDNKDDSSSVLFDFDAIDLLDFIDSSTQTNASKTTNETQTVTNWDMLLSEDEWLRTIMNN